MRSVDLARPLARNDATHEALIGYLEGVAPATDGGVAAPVGELVRRLLPTGTLDLAFVAEQLSMHPRTLQRCLAAEGITFGELVDDVRRRIAEGYLRDTDMPLGQLASELGYVEQSALTRASRRWFGASPRAIAGPCVRARSRSADPVRPRRSGACPGRLSLAFLAVDAPHQAQDVPVLLEHLVAEHVDRSAQVEAGPSAWAR